jgi:hypothetical protein
VSKRAPKAAVPVGLALAGLGLAALWYLKSTGPNKRPSVDGLPVHTSGNGPAVDESWRSKPYCGVPDSERRVC